MQEWLWPVLILLILTGAVVRRLPVYQLFVEGAKSGLEVTLTVLPNLAAMLAALHLMEASGLTACLCRAMEPVLGLFHLPGELAPLAAIRPFSGSAALAALERLLSQYGADSRIGLTASVLMGSSETIFYTVCIYMSGLSDKRTGYAIPCALGGMLAGLWVCGLFFR